MDNLEEDPEAEEVFRQTVSQMSPEMRQWMLSRFEKGSLNPRLSLRESYVLKRCMQIVREFTRPS